MIHSDLYTRLMLLGNGDEVRRCRDAHTEGQTIEESLRVSPCCWSRRFNSNQVPLIPASRRHDYANDLPPPPSWLPPFFFASTFTCAPNNNKTVQRSSRPSPALCKIVVQYLPISALAFPPSSYLSFYSCALPPFAWYEFGYLSHAISVLEARGGTRGFEFRNMSGPSRCAPSAGWRHKTVKRILFAAWMYSRLRIPWSPRPRWRLGARKKNGCGAHPKLAT
jgi:hypothetical protein